MSGNSELPAEKHYEESLEKFKQLFERIHQILEENGTREVGGQPNSMRNSYKEHQRFVGLIEAIDYMRSKGDFPLDQIEEAFLSGALRFAGHDEVTYSDRHYIKQIFAQYRNQHGLTIKGDL